MSDSIRLHPKYGVNPTIPLCFWCRNAKNEVAMLGAAYKGEAPRNMVLDYEPCPDCKGKMAAGITLIEADEREHDPTGRWAVISEHAVAELFQPEAMVKDILEARRAMISPEAFQRLFGELITDSGAPDAGAKEGE